MECIMCQQKESVADGQIERKDNIDEIQVIPMWHFASLMPQKVLVGQLWSKWNLICNSSYESLISTFILKCESIAKKSLEN